MPMSGKNPRYTLPDGLTGKELVEKIVERFSILRARSDQECRVCHDSFDWRLYRAGLTLFREAEQWVMADVSDSGENLTVRVAGRKTPRFWRDFPESIIRERLREHLDIRALLPRFELHGTVLDLKVLNSDRKTVLRCRVRDSRVDGIGLPGTLSLEGIRGYDQDRELFCRYVESLGLERERLGCFHRAAAAAGLTPGGYSTKLALNLDPAMPAGLAAVEIMQSQLAVIKQNEGIIPLRIDSEFLHDYRVALRRTRAGLGQIKGVFAEEQTELFKRIFADLGKMSNGLRDMDVALLRRQQYEEMLPDSLKSHLKPLFSFFKARQRREAQRVAEVLGSREYREQLLSWRDFLDSFRVDGAMAGKNAARPVIDPAGEFIGRALARVLTQGEKIGPSSPDSEIHRLRLGFKKLRYLMEFFASLFPKSKMERLIRQSKRLQENLGTFNDLSVQEEIIKKYLDRHLPGGKECLGAAAAAGGILARLHHDRLLIRREFEQAFESFNQPENIGLFHELCGPPKTKKRQEDP